MVSRFYSDATGAILWVLDRESHHGSWASVDYETEAAYLQWLK
ncbi:hypothetical protein [Actinomadura sp.]